MILSDIKEQMDKEEEALFKFYKENEESTDDLYGRSWPDIFAEIAAATGACGLDRDNALDAHYRLKTKHRIAHKFHPNGGKYIRAYK